MMRSHDLVKRPARKVSHHSDSKAKASAAALAPGSEQHVLLTELGWWSLLALTLPMVLSGKAMEPIGPVRFSLLAGFLGLFLLALLGRGTRAPVAPLRLASKVLLTVAAAFAILVLLSCAFA